MKRVIKNILRGTAPDMLDWIRAYRFRKRCKKMFFKFQTDVAKSLYADGDIYVLSGPFAGMRYFNDVVWGPITPKWIGSYEEELHDVISQEIVTKPYNTIIDVGAAEGYYAVGLARAQPNSLVFSFDIDPFARKLQHRLSELNNTRNLRVGNRCSYLDLNELPTGNCLVISDIEGFEYELLDPNEAPNLKHSDLLVEIHGFGGLSLEQVREVLLVRFAATHSAQLIKARTRSGSHYERLCGHLIDGETIEVAVDEHRNSNQEWLWLKAV